MHSGLRPEHRRDLEGARPPLGRARPSGGKRGNRGLGSDSGDSHVSGLHLLRAPSPRLPRLLGSDFQDNWNGIVLPISFPATSMDTATTSWAGGRRSKRLSPFHASAHQGPELQQGSSHGELFMRGTGIAMRQLPGCLTGLAAAITFTVFSLWGAPLEMILEAGPAAWFIHFILSLAVCSVSPFALSQPKGAPQGRMGVQPLTALSIFCSMLYQSEQSTNPALQGDAPPAADGGGWRTAGGRRQPRIARAR